MKNVIVALGLVEWETQFVSGLGHPMFAIQVQRRCVDGVDIRAAIQVSDCQGVIVSDATLRVSSDLLAELSEKRIPLIAITSNIDYWQELGANHSIELDLDNPLGAIKLVSEFIRGELPGKTPELDPKGLLIAVAGFGGASGRSTAVKELGWQFSKSGSNTCIIDADTYGPSLDQELGYEPNQNGILELCRSLERKQLAIETQFELLPLVCERLSLIAGLPRVSRWTDLRVSTLRDFWKQSKNHFDVVITDVGSVLELDHSLIHETSLPRRHAAALTALEVADVTLICARADSVGITRLVRGYLEFHELFAKSQVHVVLWGVMGDSHSKDVRSAVSRHTGIVSIFEITHDFDIIRKCLEQNTFIGNLDAKNTITKQFTLIVEFVKDNCSTQSQTQSGSEQPKRKKTFKRAA